VKDLDRKMTRFVCLEPLDAVKICKSRAKSMDRLGALPTRGSSLVIRCKSFLQSVPRCMVAKSDRDEARCGKGEVPRQGTLDHSGVASLAMY